MIISAIDAVKNHKYEEVELAWVGDFNPKMISLHEATGATLSRKHVTYLKIFETKIFQPKAKAVLINQ